MARRVAFNGKALGFVFLLALGRPVRAQHVPALSVPQTSPAPKVTAPAHLTGRRPLIADSLAPAWVVAKANITAIESWNAAQSKPLHNGFFRPFPEPRRAVLSSGAGPSPTASLAGGELIQGTDSVIWTASYEVQSAWAARLVLRDVQLPSTATIWVSGSDGTIEGPFDLTIMTPEREIYLPPVAGATVSVEVDVPMSDVTTDAPPSFQVAGVVEIFPLDGEGRPLSSRSAPLVVTTCFIDAACAKNADLPNVDALRLSVALIQFMQGSNAAQCTGNLLNNVRADGTPYLLTANHCILDATIAPTVVSFFDYHTATCGGPPPSLFQSPKIVGSTLLSSNAFSDTALLLLGGRPPAPRYYLGWDANAASVPIGTTLYRLSHPVGMPQVFSTSVVSTAAPCSDDPRLIFSRGGVGSVYEGSSGGAAMLSNGNVVGQLVGGCPPEAAIANTCDYNAVRFNDGPFSVSYAFHSSSLGAAPGGVLGGDDGGPKPPVPDFYWNGISASDSAVYPGDAVSFYASNNNDGPHQPTSWAWNFQVGCLCLTNPTGPNVTFTFPYPGLYAVSLTEANTAGSNTVKKTIIVKPRPCQLSSSGQVLDQLALPPGAFQSGALLASADLDGDGLPDLVAANGNTLLLYQGIAQYPYFRFVKTSKLNQDVVRLLLGTVDGQPALFVQAAFISSLFGNNALVYCLYHNSPLSTVFEPGHIALQDLRAGFSANRNLLFSIPSIAVGVFDSKGLGNSELLVSGETLFGIPTLIWTVAANGPYFSYSYSTSSLPFESTDRVLRGDFNGDGSDDLAIFPTSTRQPYVAYGSKSTGHFSTVPLNFSGFSAAVTTDINRDGYTDLMLAFQPLANVSADSLYAFLGRASGLGTVPVTSTDRFDSFQGMIAGDFDGSLIPDLFLFRNQYRSQIAVGRGDGTFVGGRMLNTWVQDAVAVPARRLGGGDGLAMVASDGSLLVYANTCAATNTNGDLARGIFAGGRVSASVLWRNQYSNETGQAFLSPQGDRYGFFYFSDPNNPEVFVKVLDFNNGGALCFVGGLTDFEYVVTFTMLASGQKLEFHKPAGQYVGFVDNGTLRFGRSGGARSTGAREEPGAPEICSNEKTAFPTPVLVGVLQFDAAAPVRTDSELAPAVFDDRLTVAPQSLTLSQGRVQVVVEWRSQYSGQSGTAYAIPQKDGFGFFYFTDPGNPEVFVKVLDFGSGGALCFVGGLSDFYYKVTFKTLRTGQPLVFEKPAGLYVGFVDNGTLRF